MKRTKNRIMLSSAAIELVLTTDNFPVPILERLYNSYNLLKLLQKSRVRANANLSNKSLANWMDEWIE